MKEKLTSFDDGKEAVNVAFVETTETAEGVTCDAYSIEGDDTKDMAVIHVAAGFKTPLQRVLKGDVTTEGYMSGKGVLSVTGSDGERVNYAFPGLFESVVVEKDDVMQWTAETDLVFYEICTPPYEDGRFENIEP